MGQIRVNCPTCGVLNEMPASLAGSTVECGGCGAQFQVAPLEPAPAQRPSRARPQRRPASRTSRPQRERGGRAAGPRGRPRRQAGPPVGAIVAVSLIAVVALVGALFGKTLVRSLTGGSGNGETTVTDGGPKDTDDRPAEVVRPKRPTKEVVRTTLAELVRANHPPGTKVKFRAVIYPAGLVQVSGAMISGGPTFGLAMDKNAAVFTRLKKQKTDVDSWLRGGLKRIETSIEDDEKFVSRFKELNAFIQGLAEPFRIETSATACAVRLKGFTRVAGQAEWKTVINEGPPSPEDFMKKWREENPFPKADGPKIPNFPPDRPSNDEILKARADGVASIREALLVQQSILRRILAQPMREFSATVEKPVDIAARTFAKGGQLKPTVFVRETGPNEQTFATKYFGTTDILLTSRPPGATVTKSGRLIGRTPTLVPDLKVGSRLEVEIRLEGHEKQSRGIDVDLSPDGVVKVNTMLWPEEK